MLRFNSSRSHMNVVSSVDFARKPVKAMNRLSLPAVDISRLEWPGLRIENKHWGARIKPGRPIESSMKIFIVPFLASMHAPRGKGRAPTPSALTADRPLALHFGCHLVALSTLAVALLADSAALMAVGAAVGLAGALAFATFFVLVLQRLRGAPTAPRPAGA
jgi:hypothetical protein